MLKITLTLTVTLTLTLTYTRPLRFDGLQKYSAFYDQLAGDLFVSKLV